MQCRFHVPFSCAVFMMCLCPLACDDATQGPANSEIVQQLEKHLSTARVERDVAQAHLETARAELEAATAESQALRERLDAASAESAATREELERLKQRNADLVDELSIARAEAVDLAAELDAAHNILDRLMAEPWKHQYAWNALRHGMTKNEVMATLGQPYRTDYEGHTPVWYYGTSSENEGCVHFAIIEDEARAWNFKLPDFDSLDD